MGRCPYQCNRRLYEDYYQKPVGHGLPVFVGGTAMRGRGLGSLLSGLVLSAVPRLKSGGKAVLKEGAKTGMQLAQDVLYDQNLKSAAKQQAQEAGILLFYQAVGRVLREGAAAPPGEPARKRIKSTLSKRRPQKAERDGRKKKRRKETTSQPQNIFG